jgi:death-on-curing protein
MDEIDFLSIEDVLFAHHDQIRRYGGDPGIRDVRLLDSAIAQPRAGYGEQLLHSFPYEMAAAYLFHVVQNHPFVDGNKRTGAVSALLFLDLNNVDFHAPPGSLYELTIAVAQGHREKQEVAEFFESHAGTS